MEKPKVDVPEFGKIFENHWEYEYDRVLGSMLNQINCFQDKIAEMKEKYSEVIEDNYFLTAQLNELLSGKNSHERCDNHEDPLHTLVKNMLQLMEIASKEKQIVVEFCQVILDKMAGLEESLVASQSEKKMELSQKYIDDLRIEYSDVIRMLEEQLSSLRAMLVSEREKYDLAAAQAERVEKEYQRKLTEAAEAVSKGEKAEKNEADMQKEVANLQMHQQELKDALQTALSREAAARDRIEEALNVAEAALHEKEVALMEQKIAKEEVAQMKNALDELIEDAGIRVKEEVENVKKQFNLRIQEMIGEMTLKEKEVQKLQEELSESTKKRRVLERQLEKMTEMKFSLAGDASSNVVSIVNLHDQIARLQAELAQEKEECNNCKIQKNVLEERLKSVVHYQDRQNIVETLKLELEESRRNQNHLLLQAKILSEKIELLESVNSDGKPTERGEEMKERPSAITVPENVLKSSDLQNIMDAQVEMKKRWRNEVSFLTQKFGKRMKELHDEVVTLRAEKKELLRQLKAK